MDHSKGKGGESSPFFIPGPNQVITIIAGRLQIPGDCRFLIITIMRADCRFFWVRAEKRLHQVRSNAF
jgi:hypothetical protein